MANAAGLEPAGGDSLQVQVLSLGPFKEIHMAKKKSTKKTSTEYTPKFPKKKKAK